MKKRVLVSMFAMMLIVFFVSDSANIDEKNSSILPSNAGFSKWLYSDQEIDLAKKLLNYSDGYFDDLTIIEYDALGHYALADLELYARTKDMEHLERAEFILGYLINSKDLADNEKAGWGLTFEYDAFGDGTTNDKFTKYTYTTTVIGNAFISAYRITKNPLYKEVANEIRETLIYDIGYWENADYICFHYSNSINDKGYRVHNVNAYSIQFLGELDSINGNRANKALIERAFNFEKDSQLENGNWYYSEDYEGARKVETDLLHWAFSGTAFYRMYELTNENRYLDLARIVTESIVNKHVTSEYKITDNSSHKWGVPETIILLKYSFFIDDDPIFLKVFDAMQEDIGPNGEYLPALDLNIYPSDIEFNHRTNSWFAYSLGFLPNLFSK